MIADISLIDNQENVLAYHNISNRFNIGINNISLNAFKSHIDFFKVLNYDFKICFDDAYEDVYLNAFPIMNKNSFRGVIFPVTGFIGINNTWDINFFINKKKHVNYDQLRELLNNDWEVGSHGHSHISYKVLSDDEILKDLIKSKDLLEKKLKTEINIFTPPFGYISDYHIDLVIKAGYSTLYLNHCYISKHILNSGLKIGRRFNIYKYDGPNSILRKLNNNKYQLTFDSLIHYCSNATVYVKKIS